MLPILRKGVHLLHSRVFILFPGARRQLIKACIICRLREILCVLRAARARAPLLDHVAVCIILHRFGRRDLPGRCCLRNWQQIAVICDLLLRKQRAGRHIDRSNLFWHVFVIINGLGADAVFRPPHGIGMTLRQIVWVCIQGFLILRHADSRSIPGIIALIGESARF